MPKFSEGDWVLFEHEVQQITKTKEGKITEVSNGSFVLSSWDLSGRVFPLTLAGKSCADWFDYYYHDLHREEGSNKLNWPDLARHIDDLWVSTMLVLGDESATQTAYTRAQAFFREVKDKLAESRRISTSSGLKLFR